MSLPDALKPILDRIAQHQQTDADLAVLRQYLSSGGQVVSQQGKYAVNVGQGQDIQVGDRIYQGADAETIRAIVRAIMQELATPPNTAPAAAPAPSAAKMSSGQRQRLEQRRATLQADWDLRNQKIQQLRSSLAIEAGTSVKFQLETELAEAEAQLAQLSAELDQIDATLPDPPPQNPSAPLSSPPPMMIPEPFTAIPVTAGILTNIATDILKAQAQSLDGTLAGQALKWAGLMEPNLHDRLHEILWKALDLYFKTYPDRDVLGVDSFFLDATVSRAIGRCILERQPIDWPLMHQAFDRQIGIYHSSQQWFQAQGLTAEPIINDFINCYRQVLREQLSLPQVVVLLELLNQNETVVAEIRASEQRLRQYIAELQTNQLAPPTLKWAYLQGQQQLAGTLSNAISPDPISPDQSVKVMQARLQPTPALFATGLCKGRLLSAKPDQYFVSHGFSPDLLADWRQALVAGLVQTDDRAPLQPYFAGDTLLGGFRLCGICDQLYTSRFSMFLLPPSQDRNVYLELGIAIGLGAPFFLIQHYEAEVPDGLAGLSRYVKGGLFRTMRRELAGQIEEYDFGVVQFVANLPPAGSQPQYLIAAGDLIEDEDFEGSIGDALGSQYPHLSAVSLSHPRNGAETSAWLLDQWVETIQAARFAIYRVDEACSPTTFLALGISIGLNRPFLMVHRANREVPLDLRGLGMYQFPNFVALQQAIVPQHQAFFDQYAQ